MVTAARNPITWTNVLKKKVTAKKSVEKKPFEEFLPLHNELYIYRRRVAPRYGKTTMMSENDQPLGSNIRTLHVQIKNEGENAYIL